MRVLAVVLLKSLRFVVPVLPRPVVRVVRRRVESWERAMLANAPPLARADRQERG